MLSKEQIRERVQHATLWLFIGQLGLLVGIEAVYIAVFAGSEKFNASYGYPSLQTIGLATSLYPICAAVGASSVLYLVHATRELVILGVSLYLWLSGYFLGSFMGGNMGALMAARVIKGLSIGAMTSVLPLYVEKVAYCKREAARLLTLFQTTVPLGILLMAVIAKLAPSPSYHTKWMQTAIPALPIVLIILNLPQKSKAYVIDYEKQHQNEIQLSAWYKLVADLRRLHKSRKATIRCCAATLAQCAGPVTAINVIFYYSSTMCQMLGFESEAAEYMSLGLYATNFVGTALSLLIINRLPRLATIQYSILGMALTHCALFIVRLLQDHHPDNSFLGLIAISLLFGFVLIFSLLFAGISLVYTSEVVSVRTRGVAVGIATAGGWACNFFIALGSAAILPLMGCYVFLLFMYLCCTMYVLFGLMPSPIQKQDISGEPIW